MLKSERDKLEIMWLLSANIVLLYTHVHMHLNSDTWGNYKPNFKGIFLLKATSIKKIPSH